MKKNNFLEFILISLLVSGCATYSKEECANMDQSQSGYKLGIDGKGSFDEAVSHLKYHCEKEHSIPVDTQKVKQGWEDGLRFYCSGNGGIRAGASGHEYSGVCKKEDEEKFFATYNPSRMSFLTNKVKELEKKIESLEHDISSAKSKEDSCESRVTSLQSSLTSAEVRAASCLP